MNSSLYFEPFLSTPLIYIFIPLAVIFVLLAVWVVYKRMRGALLRLILIAFLGLCLSSPKVLHTTRTALPDIALIVIDKSPSQSLSKRSEQTKNQLERLEKQLSHQKNLKIVVRYTSGQDNNDSHLINFTRKALQSLPKKRIAGVFLITDGAVHDTQLDVLPQQLPINSFITGDKNDYDRSLTIVSAPKYGFVKKGFPVSIKVKDKHHLGETLPISIQLNSQKVMTKIMTVGRTQKIMIKGLRRGTNTLSFSISKSKGELTFLNNTRFLFVTGIRQRLRVLLISGLPYSGEKVWRNLLKSDPSVDLVHFIMLRKVSNIDPTLVNEMALIRFPARQLFTKRLKDFDLVIFDRYSRRGLITNDAFMNIANYVKQGGALLVISGPDEVKSIGLSSTPLEAILPFISQRVVRTPFLPQISTDGLKNPITDNLVKGKNNPQWGPWTRYIQSTLRSGTALMSAHGDPLLAIRHENAGRIAMFASSQIWLWARGYQGGGPYIKLIRRLVHWLLKDPQFDENKLSLSLESHKLIILKRDPDHLSTIAHLKTPNGDIKTLNLSQQKPGLFSGQIQLQQKGLYKVTVGKTIEFIALQPENGIEYNEVESRLDKLGVLQKRHTGALERVSKTLPSIVWGGTSQGVNHIRLIRHHQSQLTSMEKRPLIPNWIALLISLSLLALIWWRES